MNASFPIEYLVITLVFVFVMLVLVLAVFAWVRRERNRRELQKAILERVGSVKDLGAFLTTDEGERFLTSLAPAQFSLHRRGLISVRVGIVILTIGSFLMVALQSNFFEPFDEQTPPRPLLMGALLLMAAGIGMLLSAAASFVIARTLGMLNRRDGGSAKDRSV